MRKITVIVLALIVLLGLTTLSFAKSTKSATTNAGKHKVEIIKGKIISVDTVKNEIVVKEDKTDVEKTIIVKPKVISSLKIGQHVKIKLRTKNNKAVSVKIIEKHTKMSKKHKGGEIR